MKSILGFTNRIVAFTSGLSSNTTCVLAEVLVVYSES